VTAVPVLELVARMRREAFSRNRNFDVFERAETEAKHARRIWRYLRSLEADLMANRSRIGSGVNLRVERRADGGRRITIEVPEVRMRRTAILSAEEYALLREHLGTQSLLDSVDR
jgi:hypothetical protein